MRPCDTCKSPYTEEIDEMVLAGWKYTEILRHIKGKYPDAENIPSYDSIRNHAKNHVEGVIDEAIESSKKRRKMIKDEIKSSIQAAQSLRKNLYMITQAIEEYWSDFNIKNKPDKYRELTRLMNTANKLVNTLLRYNEEIKEESMTEDAVKKRLMYCIRDLPADYVIKIRERWNEYGSK